MQQETVHLGSSGAFAGQEAASQTQGVTAAAALPHTTGVTAPDAGVQDNAQRAAAFEQLIRGQYKDLYDARVQDTVQKRLKGQKEIVEKYQALTPVLELLGQRYGVDAGDAEGLHRAIAQDAPQDSVQGDPQGLYDTWLRQAEEAKGRYPDFDLRQEAKNPRFRNLLKSDVDVTTAYEVLHQEQLLRDAMAYTARAVESKLARTLAGSLARPTENGVSAQSAAVVKRDVSLFTKQDRADIIRRVQRGETIRL